MLVDSSRKQAARDNDGRTRARDHDRRDRRRSAGTAAVAAGPGGGGARGPPPLVGAFAWRARPSRWLEAALGTIVVGIPVTALGFLGIGVLQFVGGLLVATGGFGVAIATLLTAGSAPSRVGRGLLRIAGASLV